MNTKTQFIKERANINQINFRGKKVIIYEDHRYILNTLRFFKEFEDLTAPINIITLDYHDDCYKNENILDRTTLLKVAQMNFKEFYNHIEFEHSTFDDDWIIAGIEYGLIKNVVNLFGQDIKNLSDLKGEYLDCSNKKHQIFHYLMSKKNPANSNNKFNEIIEDLFILDIDLDFMTYTKEGKIVAKTNEELDAFFYEPIDLNGYDTTFNLLKTLINKSHLITICKESKFCNGFDNSARFFQYLNKLFFQNKLNNLNPYRES